MSIALPSPSANEREYRQIVERGFQRFPLRRENFEKCRNTERKPVVDYVPLKMDYEVSSICNFTCNMCIIEERRKYEKGKHMDFGDFKNSLDELYGLFEIKLQGIGEPLLNPEIFNMISLAAEKDIWTRLTINGSMLKAGENYKKLIHSNPGEIQISIDGASKEVFESIRKGSKFEHIVENVTTLNDFALSLGKEKTRSWTVVQKLNAHELADIVKLVHQMKFRRHTFSIALSTWGDEKRKKSNSEIEYSTRFPEETALSLIELGNKLGVEITFWDASVKYMVTPEKNKLCEWLFERAFISADMRIVPCCAVSNPHTLDFGDARNLPVEWNNNLFKQFRKLHLDGHIPATCLPCYSNARE